MEPATHCFEGMFSTAVEDGTSNTLFRRHVLNCEEWRVEQTTHCLEGMFSTVCVGVLRRSQQQGHVKPVSY